MSETEIKKEVEQEIKAEELDTKGDPSAPAKSGVKSEPTHLKNDAEDLGPAVVKPTDKNPDSTKKVKKHSDQVNSKAKDGSLPKDLKPSNAAEEAEKETAPEEDIDLSSDVKALVSADADLSDEFKEKAATIFETAVKTRIKEQEAKIRNQYEEKLSKESETIKVAMADKVDAYLNYVVEEWMKENELAVERGIRTEIAEDFITGLKTLFKEHYIDVPEEKEDVFENLVVEVAELEEKFDEQTEKHMDTVKELNTYKAAHIFKSISEGMVDTDVEKFVELVEDVDYDTDEQYREKLNTIKNSYFKSDKKDVTDNKKTAGTNNPVVDGKSDGRMDGIMSAISNFSKK